MKYQLGLASAIAVAAAGMSPASAATTVNFDQSTNAASYAAQGLVLSGITINSSTYGGSVTIPSAPNYASVSATGGTISFVNSSGQATTSNGFGFTTLGLNAGNGSFNGATFTFLGANGTILGTQTFAPIGPNAGRSPIVYNNTYANIASVNIALITNTAGPGIFGFDDVNFTANPVAAAVPETATWAMMILGMGMVGGALRRRKAAVQVSYAA